MYRFAPAGPSRACIARLLFATSIALLVALTTIQAQIPGRNVNMVSGVRMPDGDPFLQRQNEPSMAVSTRNPLHLLGGSNDYRTVDIPNPNDGGVETGDAWLGLYKSLDGGQRWISTLLPGYPQEAATEGLDTQGQKSPLWGLGQTGYKAAADPVVRAGQGGLFYYSGLAFDRGDNGRSAIFMARFIDNNNREDRDAIVYLNTSLVATAPGTDGRFLDKPWMAVDIPRGNPAPTCRIETPGETTVDSSGQVIQEPPVVQMIPAGTVYVAYTSFYGSADNRMSEIYLTRSFDCGVTWQPAMRVSRVEDPINQGATIAIDPRNGHIFVAWRRFTPPGSTTIQDAMMMARLPSGGNKFDPPGVARRFPTGRKVGLQPERFKGKTTEVEELTEFDQATGIFQFRTNAYPAIAIDGDGRIYMAWSERGFATLRSSPTTGDARIVMVTTTDGQTFTPLQVIDNNPAPDANSTDLVGHQVMPSLAFAGGKLMVAYYDLRETKAAILGTGIFGPKISDENLSIRNTIDIRAAMGTPGEVPQFGRSVRISEYRMGHHPALGPGAKQLQYNPPNLPMFKQGTVPFLGDYIDLVPSPAFVIGSNGRWQFNTAATLTLPTFHAVWTDNRDVRRPADNNWTNYGPPLSPSTSATCVAGNAGSRNQNIYTSRITGGLVAGSPGNSKPLSTTLQRGFVVFAQNATSQTRAFRMTILAQPPGGRASFDQFPVPPYSTASPPPRMTIDMLVPPRSTASRTVYATSSDPNAQISVDISEIAAIGGAEVPGGLEDIVVLNPDIENPDIENPDIENPDIENPDIENAEVYNPDIENPDIENPDIENPDIENPDIENPDIENPDIENPDIENILVANPDIENPDIENPDIENPDIENPDIENPDIENVAVGGAGVLTDVTWNVSNTGNTTSAFNVNLFLNSTTVPGGLKTQLILHKTYRTPIVKPGTCQLAYESRNVVIANIPRPVFITPTDGGVPDQNDPSDKNATLWLGPGEIGKITLRVYDASRADNVIVINQNGEPVSVDPAFNPQTSVTPAVSSQAVATEAAAIGDTEPPLVTPTGSNLFFLQMPSPAITGSPIAPAVSVQVRDNLNGTPVPNATVTLSLGSNPGLATVSGNVATSNANGIAMFPALSVSAPGVGYTLVASATTDGIVATAVSAPFKITDPLMITTGALPGATAGLAYPPQTLQSTGGGGTTRTWTIVGGTLPAGLDLNGVTGVISGTVDPAARGNFDFTVGVVDNDVPIHSATRALTISVAALADVSVSVTDAPDPVLTGNAVTYDVTVTNAGPSTATQVSLTQSLPAATTFVSAGPGCSQPSGQAVACAIGVLPPGGVAQISLVVQTSQPGVIESTAQVTAFEADPIPASNAHTAQTLVESPIEIPMPSVADRSARSGVAYALTLAATGGTAPYSWSLIGGALPAGFTLNPATGAISGTSTTPGGFTFTVRAQDAQGSFGVLTICITVLPPLSTNLSTTSVGAGLTITQVVERLLGQGVTVSNITLNGVPAADVAAYQGAGVFSGAGSILGIDGGIILSSGFVADAAGPNDSDFTTRTLGTGGDADLTVLARQTSTDPNVLTNDKTVIEFDFVPSGNQVTFRYVFGSEEYNEFVASQYNDAFGFFITDPSGVKRNWALVPGTTQAVSINTINNGNPSGSLTPSNPHLYRTNDPSDGSPTPVHIEADGLTVVLTLTADVVPGQTHRMKLAIADAGDSAYDSWVFIEGGSFSAVENCANGIDDDGDGLADGMDPDCQVCPEIAPGQVIVTVPATAGGTVNPNNVSSGSAPIQSLMLSANEAVTITATGLIALAVESVASGPDGTGVAAGAQALAPALPAGALMARIGSGAWQLVGAGPTTLQAGPSGGVLDLAVNDSAYGDNSGSFTVTVQR